VNAALRIKKSSFSQRALTFDPKFLLFTYGIAGNLVHYQNLWYGGADNYRGITLGSDFSRVLDLIILFRYEDLLLIFNLGLSVTLHKYVHYVVETGDFVLHE
jgi:hypothetical protein